MAINLGRRPSMQLDSEDFGGLNNVSGLDDFGGTSLSTQPQGALSAATQTEPKVNELLYDPTLINETVQQPKFGGSFDNLYSTTPATPVTPAPLSTPQFNFNGDPLYGSDPVGFDPNNLGFVADQAPVQDALTYLNSNPTGTPSPEQQKVIDDYFAANPINIDPNSFNNMFGGFDLNGGLKLNSPAEQTRLNNLDAVVNPLTQQILGQNLTSNWTGQGFGSPEANARDIATLLNTAGITDIRQFGKVDKYEPVAEIGKSYNGNRVYPTGSDEYGNNDGSYYYREPTNETDSEGNVVYRSVMVPKGARLDNLYGFAQDNGEGGLSYEPIDSSKVVMRNGVPTTITGKTWGNKETGQAIESRTGRWQRQGGDDLFGGTGEGKGNTGYRVYIGEDGNPYFYTTQGSSSDLASIAPILAIAQFIPALAPFATAANALISASQGNVLGAIAGAAGLGGYSDVANAANFAGAVKSGNPLSIISAGAGLGGTDLSGVADAAGLGDLNNIGGFNVSDAAKAYRTVKAIESGDPSAIISAVGGYMQDQQDQQNQRPASPLDSLVPSDYYNVSSGGSSSGSSNASSEAPSDDFSDYYSGSEFGFEEPVSRPIAERPMDSSIGATSPADMPRIAFNPTDLYQEPIRTPEPTQDLSDKSFGSAFAQARASGAKEFLWKDNVYNTNLAPTTDKMNAGPKANRTIDTGAGMDPSALAGWGGSKVDPNFIKAAAPYLGWDPSTYFPNINIKMADPTAAYGNVPEYDYKPNEQSYLNIAPYLTRIGEKANEPGMAADVLSHELAHVGQKLSSKPGEDPTKFHMRMAQQAGLNVLGSVNRPDDVAKFNEDLDKALPYINQKYGQASTGYINNATGQTTTNKYDPSSKLFEKLTDLASLEMQTGKDLTSDPYLKETLFKDPKVVAMYNAMTIPRMTRLDPRDLPPGVVTSSDFPKGQVPLGFKIRNALRGGR